MINFIEKNNKEMETGRKQEKVKPQEKDKLIKPLSIKNSDNKENTQTSERTRKK